MYEQRKQRLADFVKWVGLHVNGDEKGEAQIFLDRLFQAFGRGGSLDVGGTPEFRVRKDKESGGGTSFADYVWKPVVLIEMKKRGEPLAKHYKQAYAYRDRLVPGKPRYMVLCNFDEFWVYDPENQLDTPKDKLALHELPDRWGPLAFLFPTDETPQFENDREVATREAADLLATCYNKIVKRGVSPDLAQRFILQTLVALFSEDIGLLPKYLVAQLLDECVRPGDTYDKLGHLFAEMNTPGITPGGRYKGVDYFNGGIFRDPARVELEGDDELDQLKAASTKDWSKVDPDIFGTLFQHSMGKDERAAFGAHYTSPTDILKIVKPTIIDPWNDAIESAKTPKRLGELQNRLASLRVLDPACGSGNFLCVAYREMKGLEARIRERLETDFPGSQAPLSTVTTKQFYGMDIIHFAVELAKVGLVITRKLAIDQHHIISERALPLDNLDKNIVEGDALFMPWQPADVIIGNPPFLGAKLLKPERGVDYVNKLRKDYANEIPGMADYCVYWFRKAHDHLPSCSVKDPFAGRAGLVGTQNIRNNQSRVGGLDYIASTGTIVEAVDNQPWSGEANVHVSIVNWIKSQDAKVVPAKKHLGSKIALPLPKKRRSGTNAAKEYEIAYRTCTHISPALSDEEDVTGAAILECNRIPQRVFQGNTPGHDGFVLDASERQALIAAHPASAKVIYPYLIGRELLNGNGRTERWLIDFEQRSIVDAQTFKSAFEHVRQIVLPAIRERADAEVQANRNRQNAEDVRQKHLERWWIHWRGRADRIAACLPLSRFIVCSRVTKRPIFVFIDPAIRPGDALQTFAFEDDYSFGILQSVLHWAWFVAKCSKLKSDFRYTPESVFETFPWPQHPGKADVDAVAEAAREVRRVRADTLAKTSGGLRDVYRLTELPGKHPLKAAHAALDAAVVNAYGFSAKADPLSQLLTLNAQVAEDEAAGKKITAPGVPANYGNAAPLITADCVKP